MLNPTVATAPSGVPNSSRVTAGFLIVLVNCCRSDPARAGAKEDARLNP